MAGRPCSASQTRPSNSATRVLPAGRKRAKEANPCSSPVAVDGVAAHRAVRSTGPPHVGTGADDAAWATAPDDAVPVARPLLGRGQLGHDRGHDVGQRSAGRRDPRPGSTRRACRTSATGPVDGVHDAGPLRIAVPERHGLVEPFRHHQDRFARRPVLLEPGQQNRVRRCGRGRSSRRPRCAPPPRRTSCDRQRGR